MELRGSRTRGDQMAPEGEFRDLSPEEAEARFRQFLLERPAALERLALRAAPAGVELDRTVESLQPLWGWIASVLRKRRTGELREGDPSWLIRGHPADQLSTSSVVLLDGLISYIGEVFTAQTGHSWELERADDRSVTHQHFVFAGGVFVPVNVLNAALRRWSETGERDWPLGDWVRASIASTNTSAPPRRGSIDVTVEPANVPDFDWSLWIDETAESQLGTALFSSLEQRLAALPGINGVVHEDREIFLVKGEELTARQVELAARSVVEQARTEAGGRG